MFTKNWKCVVVSTAIALLAFSGMASAATIATPSDQQAVAYGSTATWGATVDTVDNVLYGLAPSASTGTWPAYEAGYYAFGVEALTDGLNSPTAATNASNASPFTYAADGSPKKSPIANTATYSFAATQLDSIVVYGGHTGDSVNQGGQCLNQQNYTVEGSDDGGATWTPIGGIDYTPSIMQPWGTNGPYSVVVKTTLSDDGLGGAVLGASGMTFNALKISFGASNDEWYGNGYLEVAAYKAVVPEPSTLILLGCALAGLIAYAWRKRK